MIIDEIRTAYHAEPFQPFRIRSKSGQTYTVSDRTNIAFHPTSDVVCVISEQVPMALIDVASITDVTVEEERLDLRTPGKGTRGHLLNTKNDGTLVFRVYGDDKQSFVDYELTVDDLEVEIVQRSELVQTDKTTGRIEGFPSPK